MATHHSPMIPLLPTWRRRGSWARPFLVAGVYTAPKRKLFVLGFTFAGGRRCGLSGVFGRQGWYVGIMPARI